MAATRLAAQTAPRTRLARRAGAAHWRRPPPAPGGPGRTAVRGSGGRPARVGARGAAAGPRSPRAPGHPAPTRTPALGHSGDGAATAGPTPPGVCAGTEWSPNTRRYRKRTTEV